MRQTEHYGLNLWDLSDRIKMEDFNSDNAKLDAALNALSALAVPDTRRSVEPLNYSFQQTPHSELSVPIFHYGISTWKDWSFVLLHGRVTNPPAGTTPCAYLKPADNAPDSLFSLARFSFSSNDFLYLLMPLHDSERTAEGFFLASGQFQFFSMGIPYNQLARFGAGAANSSWTFKEALTPILCSYGIR